jgi:hypothetical protein
MIHRPEVIGGPARNRLGASGASLVDDNINEEIHKMKVVDNSGRTST